MSEEITRIVEQELKARGNPNLRAFADWLMEGMSKEGNGKISHATIINWRNGKMPSTDLLEDLLSIYPVNDRRFRFALRMLAAKSPHVWGFDGVVWRLRASRLAKE